MLSMVDLLVHSACWLRNIVIGPQIGQGIELKWLLE
jgi:hypothetical protein